MVPRWTERELKILRDAYEAAAGGPVSLKVMEMLLGRHRSNICRKARQMGLTDIGRRRIVGPVNPQRKFDTVAEAHRSIGDATAARWVKSGHPRGMLGKRHTEDAKARTVAGIRAAWANPASGFNTEEFRQLKSDGIMDRLRGGYRHEGYSRSNSGKRADLNNMYVRSGWEANYARYLNWCISRGDVTAWKYECKTFFFEAIKRGTRSYTPDFLVKFPDGHEEWHEVKGWMDDKSRVRLNRMRIYFPEVKIVIVGKEWFGAANKQLKYIIPNWE
jgi:hypothetical protein